MGKQFDKQKVIGFILGIVLFALVIAGFTYAASSWQSDDINKLVSSKCFNVFYDKGTDFSGAITPSADYTGGISVTIKMDIDSACDINAKGKIYLTTDDTTSSNLYTEGLLNYQVLINGSVTDLKGTITSSGDTVIDVGFLNKNTVATTTYTIYVWINGEYVTNEHVTSTYSGSVRSEAVQTTEKPSVNLIEHITNLYVKGNPTLITQSTSNDTYYYSYQDSTKTWGLMNDGLKVDTTLDATTTGLATTVTDTTVLTSGTEGNIRYFGPSDLVNNYIYFNCSDYSDTTTCEKWRIIGIVDGKVKLIRTESLGNYSWDYTSTGAYDNNWSDATLNTLLNETYYNSGTTTYYNGSTTGTTVDFSTNGITKATRDNNLISSSTWYLGGYSTPKGLYPNDIYDYERKSIEGTTIYSGNPFTVSTNIGLMYPSDYGYGTDLTKCSQDIYNYENEENSYACTANNWLFNETSQWLITQNSIVASFVWSVHLVGRVGFLGNARDGCGGSPVLYLDTELIVDANTDGSSSNPYRLIVEEKKETAIETITNLYMNADKTVVTNNSIDYNYATSVSLMNDRLGSNDVDADGGNIRYYGASPDNYIYFNCSSYSSQSSETCETWRIIGIVDGKLKLIRNGSIGDYSWDDGFTNDWNTSTLKDILNSGTYYSELQIKNGKTLELISDGTWYVNGISDFGIDAKSSYVGERMGNNTWPGKIALAYPSDYAYGADLNSCTNTLYNYAEEICTNVNWLTGIFTTDNYYWLITPDFDDSTGAWSISFGNLLYTPVFDMGRVVPVLYLDPTLSFNGVGDGSSGNPYQLLVN